MLRPMRVLLSALVLYVPLACSTGIACPLGDLHEDCRINFLDVQQLALKWLDPNCSAPGCGADLDGVPGVNMVDFAFLAGNWGASGAVTLVINEFMADNERTIEDPDDPGDFPDWIEIYNYGDDPVDIGGMYITDHPDRPYDWKLIPTGDPDKTTIPAGGFLVIWADGDPQQGALHVDFGLGRGGDEIALYDAYKNPVDYVVFGPQGEDRSRGRLPDGSDNWVDFAVGGTTPGQSNIGEPVKVMINEIMYHPYHAVDEGENLGQEYMELFNNGADGVDLSGWRFTNGVDFVFPDGAAVGAGEYLIVASDVNAFTAKYPGVSNVVGGWVGRLSNSGERLELVDDAGVIVDTLRYSDQGDWAVRLLGPVDHKHRGWTWSDDHDRNGESLELINPEVSNDYGRNWAASNTGRGTPGAVNSANSGDIAPLILEVEHSPVIPGPGEAVTVTARIIDELATGVTVTLHHRIDGETTFNTVAMFDDGAHRDGDAGDGVYAGEIPAQANRAIVEFYVAASDAGANSRTWPAPSTVDGTPRQVTNALYQVDNSFDPDAPWVPGSQPIYRIIMKAVELVELKDIGDSNLDGDPAFASEAMSNAQMNATFISVDGVGAAVRYRAGVRNRGNRSRYSPPMCYRVNFAHDRSWKGVTALNLNSQYTHLQLIGSVLFRLSGMPAPEARAVQVRVNGDNLALNSGRMYGSYVALEVYDGDWAENHFPDDDEGNLYRCTYHDDAVSPRTYADLDYKATMAEYRENYPKKTHASYDDYSDLLDLIARLNNTGIDDANFFAEVSEAVNIEKWVRYLAADALMGNREGGLTDGRGDDYAMYRGIEDPRFWLLPHDLDTVLGQGDHNYRPQWDIFRYDDVDGLDRLLHHPDVIKQYYEQYRELVETVFAPEIVYPVIDEVLGDWVSASEIEGNNGIKEFIVERINSILRGGYPGASDDPQIPQEFTIDCDLSVVSGLYRTSGGVLGGGNIHGTANAIDTLSVTVNGRAASWTQKSGRWVLDDGISLNPGINRIFVRAFDGAGGSGKELDSGHVDIWCDDGDVSQISGSLASNTTLDAASGPWRVTSDVTVPAGIVLIIEPGTTVYFDQGTRLTVNGRLAAEGGEFERIRFTRQPGSGATWNGLRFSSTEDNRLTYTDMEYSSAGGESIRLSNSKILIDNVTWTGTTKTVLNISSSSLIVRNSIFPSTSSQTVSGRHLLGADPYMLFEGNVFGVCTGHKQDVLDFSTSGSPVRPRFINNVFLGGGDDALDLDGTGAYVAGNVFMNFHSNFDPSEGESYGVTTGYDGGESSDHIIVRNLFVDCDNAALVKDRSWIVFSHNTLVRCSGAGINFREPLELDVDPGEGGYLEGNIFYETPFPLAYFYVNDPVWGTTDITVNHCLIGSQWHYLGRGNIDGDPLFVDPNGDFHLRPISGAVGAGPGGLDIGAYVPERAAVSGEPGPVTYRTDASLRVGGPGITHYKYSINAPSGPWSAEFSVDVPIELSGLVNAQSYTVHVLGKNAAGAWQSEGDPSASHTWTIDTSYSRLVINEVLAHTHGADPDIIELYYDGPAPMDLTDMSLTDNPGEPRKFVFSAATAITTIMNPGDYMVLYGDLTTLKNHLGFALRADGEGLYLYDAGGELIDSVEFGPQINDFSIGRIGYDQAWKLNQPTWGQANLLQPTGNPDQLKINEWLANGQVLFDDDFIELYNPQSYPVALDGLHLTDNPVTQADKHEIVSLSYIAPKGYSVFRANDGNDAWELDFKLSADGEMIGLFDGAGGMIDQVLYGPQTTDVSQGRGPDGSTNYEFFELPTPGVANPRPPTITTTTVMLAAQSADKWAKVPVSAGDVGETWKSDPDFDHSGWLASIGGPGGVGYDRGSGNDYGPLTTLDVESLMYNTHNTCYVRIPFTVDGGDLGDFTNLTLKTRYDDGYVAYINGVLVDKRNFTGTPAWDSRADGNHEADGTSFDISVDISDYISDLQAGKNVLAIQGLNVSAGSSDFIISAELEASITTIDYGEFPFSEALELLQGLRITELMYHSPSGSNFDYIELANVGETVLDLDGAAFTDGIEFVFGNTQLAPGEYVVVVRNLAAFRSTYGLGPNVAGVYEGDLSNRGEDIVLQLPWPLEAAIMRFDYSDRWYPSTDGGGRSLVFTDPTANPAAWQDPESWGAAIPSPGGP